MSKSIDIPTLKMIMAFMKPEATTPTTNGSKEDALMGSDISRIKEDLKELADTVKDGFKGLSGTYASISEVRTQKDDSDRRRKDDDKLHDDQEKRLRTIEAELQIVRTQIRTWGATIALITSALTVVSHFWK